MRVEKLKNQWVLAVPLSEDINFSRQTRGVFHHNAGVFYGGWTNYLRIRRKMQKYVKSIKGMWHNRLCGSGGSGRGDSEGEGGSSYLMKLSLSRV